MARYGEDGGPPGERAGLGLGRPALVERAARLPRVEPAAPASVIGKNTVHSIQAGMYFGYQGLIKEIVKRMKDELGGSAQAIATGGQSTIFSSGEQIFDKIDPDLTLAGLQIIAELNP